MADVTTKDPEYNVSNPHPGFGVDDNVINEYGHTKYPKWIDDPSGAKDEKTGKPMRIIVKDAEEEKAKTSKKPAGWQSK